MARSKKRKRDGECIFCGASGQVTDEHIFPESWYPDDTPPNVWKWQAPSCYECNHVYYAPKELRVFPFLAMSTNPQMPGAKGIGERAWRAADESSGSTAKDKQARGRLRELMLQRIERIRSQDVPEGADYLGWRHRVDDILTTNVKAEDLLPVIGKIARGFVYVDTHQRVTDEYSVKVFRELSSVPEIFRGMTAHETAQCGPGIVVDIVRITPYPPTCFMQIRIWDTHVWYAAVIPKKTAPWSKIANVPVSGARVSQFISSIFSRLRRLLGVGTR